MLQGYHLDADGRLSEFIDNPTDDHTGATQDEIDVVDRLSVIDRDNRPAITISLGAPRRAEVVGLVRRDGVVPGRKPADGVTSVAIRQRARTDDHGSPVRPDANLDVGKRLTAGSVHYPTTNGRGAGWRRGGPVASGRLCQCNDWQ